MPTRDIDWIGLPLDFSLFSAKLHERWEFSFVAARPKDFGRDTIAQRRAFGEDGGEGEEGDEEEEGRWGLG